jgi:hypothetical protein
VPVDDVALDPRLQVAARDVDGARDETLLVFVALTDVEQRRRRRRVQALGRLAGGLLPNLRPRCCEMVAR